MRRSQPLLFVQIAFLLLFWNNLSSSSQLSAFAASCKFCVQIGKTSCESHPTVPAVVNGWHYNRGADLYYKCSCVEGYLGDGWRCNPINECVDGVNGNVFSPSRIA
mmetsp:Transcript_32018/g.47277  ORF Transcript_32018/g.47277 Transcript_32018/m.47277 type:complete len:106 (-) Transcript_32018:149-466(-)